MAMSQMLFECQHCHGDHPSTECPERQALAEKFAAQYYPRFYSRGHIIKTDVSMNIAELGRLMNAYAEMLKSKP